MSFLQHNVLLFKVRRDGINSELVATDILSAPRHIRTGVPQASLLGLGLYIFYINRSTYTCPAIYVDDTAIFSSPSSDGLICRRLQGLVNDVCW